MYKRIAGIETEEERSDLEEELVDRFGDIPPAAQNLLQTALIKAKAHRAGIVRIWQKEDGIRFYLQPTVSFDGEKVPDMIEHYGGSLRYVNKKDTYFLYRFQAKQHRPEQIFEIAGQVAESIGSLRM
jgi:transcription-repair coupling factor (superfamily II helicase)